MSHIIGTKQNFKPEVSEYKGMVLVDFWAEWCGPCKMLSPLLDEISTENPDLKVVKVDADTEIDLANNYNINSLPTVLVFDNGKLIKTIVGFRQKSEYLNALK
ncbi:thioredoxin [Candidatus Shapirobacteria bacterium]|nr:thioredoxin [Candidatus Shapirobacteria bacterium]